MKTTLLSFLIFYSYYSSAQNIGDFTSITPVSQTDQFIISSNHTFQKIIETGDLLTNGITQLPTRPDFTGYVPISNSSTNGYLSINSEAGPGGNTVLDINFNNTTKLWETTVAEAINFSAVGGTFANCSGTVTAWGTVISSEEFSIAIDNNTDGYYDTGWNIEIDPVTKTVVNNQKLWALGNFKHENVAIHINNRTVYQGADDLDGFGYLYKFVANNAQDLSAGNLYVYTGLKNGSGSWVLINDSSIPAHETPAHRNNTMTLASNARATNFSGIEDVEIGPDGWVYFAVKSGTDRRVYRFLDSNVLETAPSTVTMETFVGNTDANQNMTYDIFDGTNTTAVAWGSGNDNLAFDGDGNLWVLQDGDKNYIWVVKSGHTQASPKVEIFGIVPIGAEPTGITFTPDYKYLFMTVQHPDSGNIANQVDAAGSTINFDKETVLAIALSGNLGSSLSTKDENRSNKFVLFPNPIKQSKNLIIKGKPINNIALFSILGKEILNIDFNNLSEVKLNLKGIDSGVYILKINKENNSKLVIE